MWFWWFMFVCNLLIPVILIIFGRSMWKTSPKDINSLYGYRTKRSMKNMDTWKFAHECCGELWWKMGWIILIASIVVQIPFYHSNEDIVGILGLVLCTLQTIAIFVSIYFTEKALKRTFNDDGIRREVESY